MATPSDQTKIKIKSHFDNMGIATISKSMVGYIYSLMAGKHHRRRTPESESSENWSEGRSL
jgi:hypothetical protein